MNQPQSNADLSIEFQGVQPTPVDKLIKVENKIRHIQMGKGYLKVYSRVVNGQAVSEAFTLASLAECMGLAPGTIEGRYHRGRLFAWKIDIPTGQSRPVRGFPLPLLENVMTIITTRGARVETNGNTDQVVGRQPKGDARFPLMYERHGREQYITVPALADHYGRSVTAIRNRLARGGMLPKAVNLNSPAQGGRPRRGWPVSMETQLIDCIENGAQFFNEYQAALNRVQARQTYRPLGSSDSDILKQIERLAPKKPGVDPKADMTGLADELEAILQRKPKAPSPDTPEQIQLPPGNPVQIAQWVERMLDAPVWEHEAMLPLMAQDGLNPEQVASVRRQVAARLGA